MQTYPWGNSRRFNAYSNYIKKQFGSRLQKVTINAGFTCPNRDGSLGIGGCTYCNNNAFSPSYCAPEKSITQQINEGIEFHKTRYQRANQYIAYFQAYSNTYAPLETLQRIYEQALNHPDIIGVVIGTRPDCVDNQKLDYFQSLSEKKHVVIEYGIESCYDKTLQKINRGHNFETAQNALIETHKRGIKTGAHIIIGLPGETNEDIINEAKILSTLPINNLKLHQLQLIKSTQMEQEYLVNPTAFRFFELNEYLTLLTQFIEVLNPNIMVERFFGEAPPQYNLTPIKWNLRNDQILEIFESELAKNNTWQGKNYSPK